MGCHEPCGPHEIFVGNTMREGGCLAALSAKGLWSIRLGGVAYDIDGKSLPDTYAPIFIHRDESERHNAIMMDRAFGPYWRRA